MHEEEEEEDAELIDGLAITVSAVPWQYGPRVPNAITVSAVP